MKDSKQIPINIKHIQNSTSFLLSSLCHDNVSTGPMRPQTKGLSRCVPDLCVLTLGRIQALGNHTKNLGYPALGPSGVTQPSLTRRNVSPPPVREWIVRTLSKGTIVQGTQRSKRTIVQGMHCPRTFARGHIGRGRIDNAPSFLFYQP